MIEQIDYHQNCDALRRLFEEVYARIPSADREKIEQVCRKIEFCTEPNIPGDEEPFHAAFYDDGIIVAVDGMVLLDMAQQRALFAHELGHARDRFDNPITSVDRGSPGERRRAEATANGYAASWGFESDLKALYGCESTDYVPE